MAIDTANKRASAISPASPWRGLWPVPDGTVDSGDRAETAYLYRGLHETAPAAAVSSYLPIWRRRRR